jgi:hypothetical protein
MPFGTITLSPGVDVTRTPTLNQAGYSASQFIRYREALAQKFGGWTKYYANSLDGIPRDFHAWLDFNLASHLSIGTTTKLNILTSGTLSDITPQTLTTNGAPNFSTTLGSATVTVVDGGISNVTILDSVYFNTPVTIGGIVLQGIYKIDSILGATSYTITAAMQAISSVPNAGAVPVFTTVTTTPIVTVTLDSHGVVAGDQVYFTTSTTGNGVTVQGIYTVNTVLSPTQFTITANTSATASSSFTMNGGNAQLLYYIALGPPATGVGFGLGAFGVGAFGSGVVQSSQQGTPITTTDWTTDNWGATLLANPRGGGIYAYDPVGGFRNASLITSAPTYAGGIFVSTNQQILVAWGATTQASIGTYQDSLLIAWSDSGDYTTWIPLQTNQAGSFRVPFGSRLRGGMACASQNLLWTDLDCWAMTYIQPPLVFSFNRIGAGAGAVSCHAMQALRGSVYWMGPSNFYVYDGSSVGVIPCPVWDAVFQNLDKNNLGHVRAMPNTAFDEVGWLYPSASSGGECDSYVKFNLSEPTTPWDIGSLPRSAWLDQSILGPPLGASPQGVIYQHETGNDADGAPMNSSFTTGYSVVGDGENLAFVDWMLPDMRWGTYGTTGAQVSVTYNVVDFPNDTPRTYGPFLVDSSTRFTPVRFRGRQVSATIASNDLGSFWRLGAIRYRYSIAGRR